MISKCCDRGVYQGRALCLERRQIDVALGTRWIGACVCETVARDFATAARLKARAPRHPRPCTIVPLSLHSQSPFKLTQTYMS